MKHTADAVNLIKVYFPLHLVLAVTSEDLPIIEIIVILHVILIFQSFKSSRFSHTYTSTGAFKYSQKETAFKNKSTTIFLKNLFNIFFNMH